MTGYRDDLVAFRQQRAEREREQIQAEFDSLAQAKEDSERMARAALERGDDASADLHVGDADFYEGEIAQLVAKTERLPKPPLSPEKQQWIYERSALAADPATVEAAGKWHNHLINVLGYEDDSPEYFRAMETVLEPAGYEKDWSPDDVVAACGITPDEYNSQVVRLQRAKSAGGYPGK